MTTWLSSWRRLLTTTGVCFTLFLALLAWRVSAGEDPVLASVAAQQQVTQTSTPATTSTPTTAEPESTAPSTQATTPTTQAS